MFDGNVTLKVKHFIVQINSKCQTPIQLHDYPFNCKAEVAWKYNMFTLICAASLVFA